MIDVDSFAELLAKLEVARDEYQRAFAAQREALFSYTDEPDPGTAQDVYQANETLKSALGQYTDALDRLTDHVLTRHDLRRADAQTINDQPRRMCGEDRASDRTYGQPRPQHGGPSEERRVAKEDKRYVG